MPEKTKDLFQGFSKLTRDERFARLMEMGALNQEDMRYLKQGGLKDTTLAEKFVENVIGFFQLPLGVATNFHIDGRDVVIPMAVEETSIIAAASKTARWVRENGTLTTRVLGEEIIGQIQIAKCQNFAKLVQVLETHQEAWIDSANKEVAGGIVQRGGGVRAIDLRQVPRGDDGGVMAVFHVRADMVDAMGANIMNQVCEYLKGPIEEASGEQVTMCILSNLVDSKLTEATVEMMVEPELGQKIAEASLFAQQDPYRAATHNKGVLNGIDPILIATGNDWRAVEAGVHAYAARSGQYRAVTTWTYDEEASTLKGVFTAPVVVGTVGGVTRLHPTARMALQMLGVERASDLSRICAAVGLVQNLGALRALSTVGIIEGHMKLHIRNLTLGAGAKEKEIPVVQKRLEEILALRKRISLSQAIEVLRELRSGKENVVQTHP